jgi:hypothetical protein
MDDFLNWNKSNSTIAYAVDGEEIEKLAAKELKLRQQGKFLLAENVWK